MQLADHLEELYEELGVESFLDDLRESGDTNMWGAAPYLVREFSIVNPRVADVFLQKWMEEFKEVR
jgi:hypothetical protein